MSQLETNPLVNSTIVTRNPNQIIETLPVVQVHDFSNYNPLLRHTSSFGIPQTDWVSIAATEKFYESLTWKVGDTGSIKSMEMTWNNLKKLMPIGTDFNSYVNLDTILFNIKKTDNAFYQGSLIIAFDPSPSSSFYSDFHKIDISLIHIWQLQHIFLNPKTSGDLIMSIPINLPFEFIKNGSSSELESYMNDYSFGRLIFYVMDGLATQSTTLQLSYPIRAQLLNASTSGLHIKNV